MGPDECPVIGGHVLQLRDTELRESISFAAAGSKQTCSLSRRVTLLHPFRSLTANTALSCVLSEEWAGLVLLAHLGRTYRASQAGCLAG